jgi:carbon-monoxide dehydrogenase large subunit
MPALFAGSFKLTGLEAELAMRHDREASQQRIGDSTLRVEDRRFLSGKGQYTDDLVFPGQLYAAFVRSQHAHAEIKAVDATDALQMPGVRGVFTSADLKADGVGAIPCIWEITCKDGSKMLEPDRYPLAVNKVRHVGEAIAVVVADSEQTARLATQCVEVELEPIRAVVTAGDALATGAPVVHDGATTNLCFDWSIGDFDKTELAFSSAAKIVQLDLVNSRIIAHPMEPRAVNARYHPARGDFEIYTSSQNPHLVRMLLCHSVLHVSENKMRVVAPDVGGGFGVKCYVYPEEAVIPWLSKKMQSPVKWTADRSETFLSDAHARDHETSAELALDGEARILGLKVSTKANLGAYLSTWGPCIPTYLYAPMLSGQYQIPTIYAEVKGVFSNTLPVDAYRGAGRPEANYVVERLMDVAAAHLDMDRVAFRKKNLISRDQMPYLTATGMTYDTGDFDQCLTRALCAIDYDGFEQRRSDARVRGKLRGLGLSCYIEACGLSPSRLSGKIGSRIALYESGQVRLNPDGTATVFTGTHSHGQGHETAFAQIVSDILCLPFEDIEIVHGDTARIAFGLGTYGSRSAAVGGSAIAASCQKVLEKGRHIAAHMLETTVDKIIFKDGNFAGPNSNRLFTIREIARSAYVPHNFPLDHFEPGLDELSFYDPLNFTFPNGAQIAEVEIDPETGVCEVCRFVAVDDFGTIINPMIVEGQVHGGLAQGIGQALLEHCRYDEETGQLLTGTFMDYCMPRASDLPPFEVSYHEDCPCTHNPLGVKGCGEAGTIGGTTTIMSAVVDSLKEFGVTHIDMPATPEKIWATIRESNVSFSQGVR